MFDLRSAAVKNAAPYDWEELSSRRTLEVLVLRSCLRRQGMRSRAPSCRSAFSMRPTAAYRPVWEWSADMPEKDASFRMSTALITGITGQDGSYLAELLLNSDYRVVGLVRDTDSANSSRIVHIRNAIELVQGDLLVQSSLEEILRTYRPTEVYNLAARVPTSLQSFLDPVITGEITGLAVLRLLEAIHVVDPAIRFCQASSNAVFGDTSESPQSETTPFCPRDPYGAAKLYGHWITAAYRSAYGMFACSAILFNHESPRRREEFVSKKISRAAARISAERQSSLHLGDLDATRDWGYAPDYMRALWLMMRSSAPDDYVLATGETHSVREFCQIAFEYVGLNYEKYIVQDPYADCIKSRFPAVGNSAKAQRVLGWRPTKMFRELVCTMVASEVAEISR